MSEGFDGGMRLTVTLIAAVVCCWGFAGEALGSSGERAFERVSPAYKGGYGVANLAMESPDGERVAFSSLGIFSEVQWDTLFSMYLAERSDGSGWSTSSLQPPPTGEVNEFSSGMEYALSGRGVGKSKFGGQEAEFEFLIHRVDVPDLTTSWEPFVDQLVEKPLIDFDGKPFRGVVVGSNSDLCHLVLGYAGSLLPETVGAAEGQLYDYVSTRGGCSGTSPNLRLVALDNAGNLMNRECKVDLGLQNGYVGVASTGNGQESSFNAVSSDGDTIFFTASVEKKGNCVAHQLFARLGGERTVEVSKPLLKPETCGEVPCPGALTRPSAYFKGASEDGSSVFFTTQASLVEGDKDSGNDLYLARMGCEEGDAECSVAERRVISLVQASQDQTVGQPADVVGVLRVAPDGSRVYFVARGVLSEGSNPESLVPIIGADNLYVYDARTAKTTLVAELCSGPELSGAVRDEACPADLTGGKESRNDSELWGVAQEVGSTRDGRVLVFASYGRLLEEDADSARDIYRYDSDTGLLFRVSSGEEGYDSSGNDTFDASIVFDGITPGSQGQHKLEIATRVVSDDGSRIVFSSAGPLSPRAVNGRLNIYEWHGGEGEGIDGAVSMLSGGASLTSDQQATISPTGRDVFFLTSEGLVAGDEDELNDIYDARIGGGFEEPQTSRQSCAGDACQGPLTNPVPLLVQGTAAQEAGENFTPPAKKKPAKKKRHRSKGKNRRAHAKHGRKGRGR